MNPSATRSLSDSLSGDPTANSEVMAKKRKIDEDIKNLYEDFGTVMDDYEETEYGEEDYEEEEEEDCEEDYYCSDLECSSEDGSDCCVMCNGDFPIEESQDEEDEDGIDEGDDYDQDEDGIDEGDDYDQDEDEDKNSQSEDCEKMNEMGEAPVKEKDDNAKDGEGAAKAIEDREGEKERDEVIEAGWHPLFEPDAPTVVLLSNDNQKLSVDRHLLSSHSEVFDDLFSLPASDLNVDHSQPIFVDEKAEVLAAMLSDIQEYDISIGLALRKSHDLAFNYTVLRSHDRFQVPDARRAAERRLQSNLEQDPFAGFAFASQHDDLQLGRKAIKLIDLQVGVGGRIDFWKRISDAKPSWQLALAQLVMPFISRYHDEPPPPGVKSVAISYHVAVKTDLRDIAAAFSPRD